MPNLAGVFDSRPQPADPLPTLDRFAAVLSVAGVTYHNRRWHDRRFGAVNLVNDLAGCIRQPAVSTDGSRVLFLDGEVYNLDELGRAAGLGPDHLGRLTPCEVCLALFEAQGPRLAGRLNGQFNIAVYDAGREAVCVFNDRLADRPLYFSQRGGVLYFALEQKAILSALDGAPAADEQGIVELLAFGHTLGDRTLFEGVSALPQGAVLTADRDRVRVEKYWQPAYRPGAVGGGLREAAGELTRRVVAATARRARRAAPLGMFLSGGLDSRFVAAALARITTDVTAFTLGPDTSRDVQYARVLAARLGFRHRTLRHPDPLPPPAVARAVWRSEGVIPFTDCLSMEVHRFVRPEAGVIFNGHFGDALSGGHLLPQLFLLRTREELVSHILAKRSWLGLDELRGLVRPDAFPAVAGRLRDAVHDTLRPHPEDRLPLLYNLWDLTVRQRRYTFPTPSVDRYLLEQLSPFLDNEVYEFALGLPLRWLFAQRCYIRAILAGFPKVARVPWARTGRPIETATAVRLARLALDSARRRVARLAGRRRTGPPWASRSRGLELKAVADQFLASPAFPGRVLDSGRLRVLVDEHFGGRPHEAEMSVLLTLAMASRLFLEAPVRRCPEAAQPVLS
jgi:asparagine synthetase B (glutamine-hydrolysing)